MKFFLKYSEYEFVYIFRNIQPLLNTQTFISFQFQNNFKYPKLHYLKENKKQIKKIELFYILHLYTNANICIIIVIAK